jgi:hypothetical protein
MPDDQYGLLMGAFKIESAFNRFPKASRVYGTQLQNFALISFTTIVHFILICAVLRSEKP